MLQIFLQKGELRMANSDNKKNIQIYPSKKRVVTNDKLSKVLFNLTDADYQYLVDNQDTISFVEMKHHKKFGEIVSPLKIDIDGESFSISEPLNQFDSAVLSVCISEWLANNKITTPAIIFRGLTGKIGKHDAEPSKDQLAAIFHSVNKLMRLQLTYNMAEICEKLNYNDGKPELLVSTLLPSNYIKASTVNGNDATIIYFTDESPMLKIAKLKNEQLLTYDATLLDVPNQQNTPMNITVKNYVMQRIQEIKLHRLNPTITFEDLFKKCRIEKADNKIKQRARDTMIDFITHLKSKSEIINFEVTKNRNSFYSVKFTYGKKVL